MRAGISAIEVGAQGVVTVWRGDGNEQDARDCRSQEHDGSHFASRVVMSPERFVVAAEHGGQTIDLWKLVRYQHRFVAFSCEFPTYHRTWKDGQRPHATAQDGLESAPIHPDLAAPMQAHLPDRKAKAPPSGAADTLVGHRRLHADHRAGLHLSRRLLSVPDILKAVAMEEARRSPGDRTRRSDGNPSTIRSIQDRSGRLTCRLDPRASHGR